MLKCLLSVLALLLSSAICAQIPSEDIPAPTIIGGRLGAAYLPLVEDLRRGGYAILFRHDRTTVAGLWDFVPYEAGGCEQQRGLSEAGRASARAIGAAIRQLDIPVTRVLSSTYCRAIESATLMFGGIHASTGALIGADGVDHILNDVRSDIERLLDMEQPAGGNLMLVGHHGTIDALTTRMLDEGDALIFRAGADGRPEIVAHMPAARWEEIARDLDRLAIEQSREAAR